MSATNGQTGLNRGPDPRDELEMLRALAVRLAIFPYPGQEHWPDDIQLVVGELPANLPFSLPVPEGSHVLGGVVSPLQGTTLILQTDLPPGDAIAFYRERLLAEGWTEPGHDGSRGGGFLPSTTGMESRATFCRSSQGPALIIFTVAEDDGRTGVRLSISGEQGPLGHICRQQRRGAGPDTVESILPALVAPPNTRLEHGGGGGSSDRIHSLAMLAGDLDLAALAAHYNPQLERAGWAQQDGGQNGPVSWSTWTFEHDGEPWRGTFYIMQRPDLPGDFVLYIQVEWAVADEERPWHPGGWSSISRQSRS